MRIKALLGGLAAVTLAAQPLAATASSYAAAPVEGENAMGGEGSALLGIGIFVAVVAGFYLIADSDDNDEPASA